MPRWEEICISPSQTHPEGNSRSDYGIAAPRLGIDIY